MKKLDLIKKIPFDNFHILGYISILMLIYASLFVGLFEFSASYSFYILLRWIVSIFSFWCAYRAYKINPESKSIGIAFLAVLFNPIVKITFEKTTWEIIDFVVMILFIKILFSKKYNK